MKIRIIGAGFCCWAMLVAACTSSPETVAPEPEPAPQPSALQFAVPANFPPPQYAFEQNSLTQEGFELGRLLFYDPRLSSDGSVACGACHRPAFAFADHSHDLSHGVGSTLGSRNAPSLANLAWQREFFWDGGANHLELTPLNAITNPAELGETVESILAKINKIPAYRDKSKAAFGKAEIDSQIFLRALTQFTGMLVSANSKYDKYIRKENGTMLTSEENQGLQLFQAKCATCHASDLFTDQSYRNNGLDSTHGRDKGRELVTFKESDRGKFEVPSLRNITMTPPYMHDGRFHTLRQVLDHYASGVKDSPTLDPLLRQDRKLGISLTEDEKTKLIAFLNTLTDTGFSNDKRFTDPFGNTYR